MAYDATDFVVTEVPAPVRDPRSITDPRERVAYLRDFLRRLPPERFDMTEWAYGVGYDAMGHETVLADCGTRCCIGGWTNTLWPEELGLFDGPRAMGTLGLSVDLGRELFFGNGVSRTISNLGAANVLDHYLATGKIDWSVA